jgi:RNA-directed DNA polymerase
LTFLGWNIRKYNGKLLMKPSKANVKAHLDKIREVIKGNKTAKQANLIRLLNPVLRGWANYHSHVVAKKTFARIDANVWSMLWRWAARRHPKKGARWVKEKYFKSRGTRNWVFAATEQKEDGTRREVTLLKESDTPIRRHVKIQSRRESARPKMGAVFRVPMGQENAELVKRSPEVLPCLAKARWAVFYLPSIPSQRALLGGFAIL